MAPTHALIDESTGSQAIDSELAGRWIGWGWLLAVLFHLAGNPGQLRTSLLGGGLQVAWVALVAAAALAQGRRAHPWLVPAAAATHLAVLIVKWPVVGSHEVLLFGFELAAIAALVGSADGFYRRWRAGASMVLITAYTAFVFAKFNADFFDTVHSCAALFAGEYGLSDDAVSQIAVALPALAIVAEGSIAVLLWFHRTRWLAAMVGVVFHWVLALPPVGHIFDFSAVLFVLFGLLVVAPDARLRFPIPSFLWAPILVSAALVVFLEVQRWVVAWPVWLGLSLWWIVQVFRHATANRSIEARPRLLPAVRWPALIIVGLTVANAVAPYVRANDIGAFTMYSNLAINDAGSNHFVVGGALFDDPPTVQLAASTSNDFDAAISDGRRIQIDYVADWLHDNPGDTITLSAMPGLSATGALDADSIGSVVDELGSSARTLRSWVDPGPQPCRRTFDPLP